MFTKESLRTAFETLSKIDKWDKLLVAGGKDCDEDYPHFKSHEDMIDTLSSNEDLLKYINENAQDALPCFEISSDSDIGRLIATVEEDAADMYDVKGYITKEKVFEMGYQWESCTANTIYIYNVYVTYITESGKVIVCDEWNYEQNVTDEVSNILCRYRRQCKAKNIGCQLLGDYFEEFKGIFDC